MSCKTKTKNEIINKIKKIFEQCKNDISQEGWNYLNILLKKKYNGRSKLLYNYFIINFY